MEFKKFTLLALKPFLNDSFSVVSAIWNASGSSVYIDSNLESTFPSTLTGENGHALEIGGDSLDNVYGNLGLMELRIFNHDKTSDRATIESEMNSVYTIY